MAKYNAKEVEKDLIDFWSKKSIYKFDINDNNKKIYSIDTPPPTISGNIHIGHIFSYTQTEIIARYQRMLGKNLFYPFGFDDNGLPTERLVEKEIGKKANVIGREKFIEKCYETTQKYRSEFKDLFNSFGFSVDWEYEYHTISNESQKIAQLSFMKLLKDGFIENRLAPSLYCSECKTVVAQAEIEDEEFDSVFYDLNFTLEKGESVVIATTRPELLPACVAVLVNPEDERYKKIIGDFIITPLGDKVKIVADEQVSIEKGTGAVMCCTYGDELDLEWVKKHNLPEKIIVSDNGLIINTNLEEMNGLHIKKARKFIVDYLREKNFILKEQPIVHTVKTHERCGTPMEIIPTSQWFVNVLKEKEAFLEIGNKINWYPENLKARYNQWVENLKWDWAISRQRYFGIPIPLWKSKITGEYIFADETELPIDPRNTFPKNLPEGHKEEDLIPEMDVLDTWATSSLTPFINGKWESQDSLMDKIYPMNLRPQAHDIIRTWTFYTIVQSKYHFDSIPWEDIMISGHVLAGKNEKISKSKGNTKTTPKDLLLKYSADSIRYWTAGGSLGKDIVFDEQEIVKGQKLVNKLWNASSFVIMNLDKFTPNDFIPLDKLEYTDIWIMDKLQNCIKSVKEHFNRYEIGLARHVFENFFWRDYCDNYLEIVKMRVYKPENFENGIQKQLSARTTLYISLNAILKMIAPFLPFVSEKIYQDYYKEFEKIESIHNTLFADDSMVSFSSDKLIDIEDGISQVLSIIEKVRKFKSDNRLKLSTEIEKLTIIGKEEKVNKVKLFIDDLIGVTKALNIDYSYSTEENGIIIYFNEEKHEIKI